MTIKGKGCKKKFVTSVKRCDNICNIFYKQNNRIDKSAQCQSCNSRTHKKCVLLNLAEIYEIE